MADPHGYEQHTLHGLLKVAIGLLLLMGHRNTKHVISIKSVQTSSQFQRTKTSKGPCHRTYNCCDSMTSLDFLCSPSCYLALYTLATCFGANMMTVSIARIPIVRGLRANQSSVPHHPSSSSAANKKYTTADARPQTGNCEPSRSQVQYLLLSCT